MGVVSCRGRCLMAAEGGQQEAKQQLYHHPSYNTGFKTKQVGGYAMPLTSVLLGRMIRVSHIYLFIRTMES